MSRPDDRRGGNDGGGYRRCPQTSGCATDARFQQDVLVAEYAEILRRSVRADQADDGLDELALQVGRLKELLPRDDDVAEFVDLVRQAAWIAGG